MLRIIPCGRISPNLRIRSAFVSPILMIICFVLLMAMVANAKPGVPPCSGKKPAPGNSCGPTVLCTFGNPPGPGNCSTWFTSGGGLSILVGGLPTDNWNGQGLLNCGNGGNCEIQPDGQGGLVCVSDNGAAKFTLAVFDGGSCYVAP